MAKKINKTSKKVASKTATSRTTTINGFKVSKKPLNDSPTDVLFKHIAWSLSKSKMLDPEWRFDSIRYSNSKLTFKFKYPYFGWGGTIPLRLENGILLVPRFKARGYGNDTIYLDDPDFFKRLSEVVVANYRIECDFTLDSEMPHIKLPIKWKNPKA